MRKLTFLLLAGALLVITGGTSVAGDKNFAILECFLRGGDASFVVGAFSHSFDERVPECRGGNPCAPCAAETIGRGLILVETQMSSTPDSIQMLFTTKKAVLKR